MYQRKASLKHWLFKFIIIKLYASYTPKALIYLDISLNVHFLYNLIVVKLRNIYINLFQ